MKLVNKMMMKLKKMKKYQNLLYKIYQMETKIYSNY